MLTIKGVGRGAGGGGIGAAPPDVHGTAPIFTRVGATTSFPRSTLRGSHLCRQGVLAHPSNLLTIQSLYQHMAITQSTAGKVNHHRSILMDLILANAVHLVDQPVTTHLTQQIPQRCPITKGLMNYNFFGSGTTDQAGRQKRKKCSLSKL